MREQKRERVREQKRESEMAKERERERMRQREKDNNACFVCLESCNSKKELRK